MPLFGSKPTKKDTAAFGRGKQSSAAAAEKYAANKRRKAEFAKAKRAAQKRSR